MVGVAGLILPLAPAEGVTVQVWRLAEQSASLPPFWPAQVQFHGPEPLTVPAVPAVQRLVLGALVKVPPFDAPQTPSTAIPNATSTVQLAVIALVVYVKGAVPEAGEPPQVPPTVAV